MALNTIEAGGAWRSPYLEQYMPIAVNVADDQFYGNIRVSIKRDLPWLQQCEAHDGHAVLVGGGPSLLDTLEEVRWRAGLGQTIIALNNTASFLIENGIVPNSHVLLDARVSNARFVVDRPVQYLIASQCAPETFDAAENHAVTLWHPHVAGIQDIIGDRETALIGGGTTVGLQAIAIMFALGYRKFHLYGFDSSYKGGAGHAYDQPENENDEVIQVELNGRKFLCARWMAHQADEFKNVAIQLAEQDCIITVAGDGLLPHMARLLMNPPAEDAACYDMKDAPASWDFVTWLTVAEMSKRRRGVKGPLRVAILPGSKDGFRDDKLPVDAAGRKQLLENVMRPALALIGAVEDPTAATGYRHHYLFRDIFDNFRNHEWVPKFYPPDTARENITDWLKANGIGEYITITLRETEHWPLRNSNVEAWLEFAKTCGERVVFVRDTAKADEIFPAFSYPDAARDLHVRAALYEKAKCNLLVSNGPAAMLFASDMPFLYFKPLCEGSLNGTPEWWENVMTLKEGEQLPWANDTQRIVWADDTLENIRKAWSDFNPAIPQTETING